MMYMINILIEIFFCYSYTRNAVVDGILKCFRNIDRISFLPEHYMLKG